MGKIRVSRIERQINAYDIEVDEEFSIALEEATEDQREKMLDEKIREQYGAQPYPSVNPDPQLYAVSDLVTGEMLYDRLGKLQVQIPRLARAIENAALHELGQGEEVSAETFLDEEVFGMLSSRASLIMNSGINAQLDFLADNMSLEDLEKLVVENAEVNSLDELLDLPRDVQSPEP